MLRNVIWRVFLAFVSASICWGASSCSTPERARAPKPADSGYAASANLWKPYLLYRLNAPYRRLYVEVDSVQGCEPSDATIAGLRNVLTNYCDKPDGIEIVRHPPIPRKHEPGLTAEQLACRLIQGPPASTNAPQPAFLEVLFYDSALFDSSAEPRLDSWNLAVRHPQTDYLPYPVVVMNTRYFVRESDPLMMRHEAGHVLGLVTRTNDADSGHCSDPNCIMYKTLQANFHFFRYLLGESPYTITSNNFCQRCLNELEADAKSPPSKMRFAGPVLIRSEPGYDVLALPNFIDVIFGGMTNNDLAVFREAARTNTDPGLHVNATVRNMDSVKFAEVAGRAGSDRYSSVRHVVAMLCEKAGFFTNAIDIYRQSIQSEPDDDVSYNGLAWLEAACPDPQLRDGAKAVSDAQHACDLALWKDATYIDTLAAACAESGDFQHAVNYENQAISAAAPGDPQNDKRLNRLSLYKQSKPVRME